MNDGLIRFNLDRDDEQAAFDAFSEVFGEAVVIERDFDEEERLLGLLQDQRGSSLPLLPLVGALGVVVVGGSYFAYRNSDRRARSSSAEPQTSSGSESAGSSPVEF